MMPCIMRHHICGLPKICETKKNVGFSRYSFFGPKKLQYCLIPAFNNSVLRRHHHHYYYYYYYYYHYHYYYYYYYHHHHHHYYYYY